MSPEGQHDPQEDIEATRPNPAKRAEQARLSEELRDIAAQTHAAPAEATSQADPERARAERIARHEDDFFAEGGISGHASGRMWFVENAAGQYMSFASPEAAFAAQKASDERRQRAAVAQTAEAAQPPQMQQSEAGEAQAPENKSVAESESSPETEAARLQREKTEDLILGSAARQIGRTITGGISVRANGEILTYKTPEEYDQARQRYVQRKQAKIQTAQGQIDTSRAPDAELREAPPAEPRAADTTVAADAPPAPEATPEAVITPEQAEEQRQKQESINRLNSLDRLMLGLRNAADRELQPLEIRLRDVQDGSSSAVFHSREAFTQELNRANQDLQAARARAGADPNPANVQALIEQTKTQAQAVDRAYDSLFNSLTQIMYPMPANSRIRSEMQAFLQRSYQAKRTLQQLSH